MTNTNKQLPAFGSWKLCTDLEDDAYPKVTAENFYEEFVPPKVVHLGLWMHEGVYCVQLFKVVYWELRKDPEDITFSYVETDPFEGAYNRITYHMVQGPDGHSDLRNLLGAPAYWATFTVDGEHVSARELQDELEESTEINFDDECED